MHPVYSLLLILFSGTLTRLCMILFYRKTRRSARSGAERCSLAVFLGSGGHTSEALTLLSALDFSRYSPRVYVVSHGDHLSAKKARALESIKNPDTSPHSISYRVITIPRARRVHQSLLTTPFSSAWSLAVCVYHVTLAPFLGLPSPRLIYVESFARVRKLSLSGRILYRFVDRFIVQWPELVPPNKAQVKYGGWLV
ncbi:hypothetical protein NM688_g3292 [Phlebia brevispora]|uniref:Uncharacterized protein n=1 Tax=Phlebia brevispora TaxID=194682 RepID=A0ACC1T671_9APHY|nr:hypothetical protein NM688_g3292 [Phlebia brevispora]